MDPERNPLVCRINRALDLPMAFLALVLLGLVLTDMAGVVPAHDRIWLGRLNWAIWAAFALEFAFKLVVAADRRAYLRGHWFDAAVVVVPMFRVVRALRILQVTRAFPLFRLVSYLGMGLRGTRLFVVRYGLGYLSVLSVLVTGLGAAGAYLLERNVPGTRFSSYGDALWWSAALMTTIGSDMSPRTGLGRLLAVAMMLFAMVVVVYLIGALSSELLRQGPPAAPTVSEGMAEAEGEDRPD